MRPASSSAIASVTSGTRIRVAASAPACPKNGLSTRIDSASGMSTSRDQCIGTPPCGASMRCWRKSNQPCPASRSRTWTRRSVSSGSGKRCAAIAGTLVTSSSSATSTNARPARCSELGIDPGAAIVAEHGQAAFPVRNTILLRSSQVSVKLTAIATELGHARVDPGEVAGADDGGGQREPDQRRDHEQRLLPRALEPARRDRVAEHRAARQQPVREDAERIARRRGRRGQHAEREQREEAADVDRERARAGGEIAHQPDVAQADQQCGHRVNSLLEWRRA